MGRGSRVLRQVLVAAALAAFVVVCLRLGWWQFERYRSSSGSLQNLGYTLQWPTFAIFALVAAWRLSRLERQRRAAAAEAETEPRRAGPPEDADAPVPERRPLAGPVTPASVGPHRNEPGSDDELAAYNRYLAELHAADRAGTGARHGKVRNRAR